MIEFLRFRAVEPDVPNPLSPWYELDSSTGPNLCQVVYLIIASLSSLLPDKIALKALYYWILALFLPYFTKPINMLYNVFDLF